MTDSIPKGAAGRVVDEIDRARAQEYALLATLLTRSPDAELLSRLAALRGDASPIGIVHIALAEAARRTDQEGASREFFALFAGLGEGALLPYASHYLAETLYGRPLVRVRETLDGLGIEKTPEWTDPEDHAGFLCEIMAGLAGGSIAAPDGADRDFFERHLSPWIRRFFHDLERAKSADFYASVGALGRTFIDIEAEAFALSA
ncbi:molecular chaperone TorD family protein [Bradyrhizobium sp. Arg237L]|uniref:TorD/DmsD family molecular chaperone n=1 Tax=Bradyrhizobium sp. Arg237L TaxID=3003352 RepID=UPI00249E77DD|nr:molecular chaperone TorD family protein [Bradyrhizobium sp. Arg237L]MDI4238270.1 molecular chaperone TorD family protein [Bradyrhizobium sp. Arg237L]